MTDVDPWRAPCPRVHLNARLSIPGSKSLTARHLIVAALAAEPSRLSGVLRARDTDLMIEALRSMGATITGDGESLEIVPGPVRAASMDVGLAGTVLRFLTALAATTDAPLTFSGDEAMKKRPITPLLSALADLGIDIETTDGHLPLTLRGPATTSAARVDASGSSQFVSALLLAGPHMSSGISITHTGETLPSLPHIDMTLDVLRRAGAVIDQPSSREWIVHPGPLHPGDIRIEPDLSNASVFLAAAAVTGSTVTITDWPEETTQAGDHIRSILTAMGAQVEKNGTDLTVTGRSLHGIDLDLSEAGELTPTVAAMAALADSPSRLTGIGHLRGHETDRLAAIATEINSLGGDARETDDGLVITPRAMHGAMVRAYGDHRMATFGAIIGLVVEGVTVDDIGATSKTLPTFTQLWQEMIG